MAGQWEHIEGNAGALAVHRAAGTSAPGAMANAVVVCHGFPLARNGAPETGTALPLLAERLAAEAGWRAMAGCLRGVGESAGDFSLAGWLDDLKILVDDAVDFASGGGVWLVGFGTTGALALCVAADDSRVRGVAGLGAPATFADWANDVETMVDFARRVGVVHTPGFPSDPASWGDAFGTLLPLEAAARVAPRPILLVHGADDDEIPSADARALADAAGRAAELCVLPGAGHRLRADPRAMAILSGWLERQGP